MSKSTTQSHGQLGDPLGEADDVDIDFEALERALNGRKKKPWK